MRFSLAHAGNYQIQPTANNKILSLGCYTPGDPFFDSAVEIIRYLIKTAILTVCFGLVSTSGCYIGRNTLIGLFLKDAANAEIAKQMMFWLLIASPLLGFYYLSSNFLQAAGNAFFATLISVLRQGALLIPCLYIMHAIFGLTGVAVAHTVSDVVAVIIAVALLFVQYGNLKKSLNRD